MGCLLAPILPLIYGFYSVSPKRAENSFNQAKKDVEKLLEVEDFDRISNTLINQIDVEMGQIVNSRLPNVEKEYKTLQRTRDSLVELRNFLFDGIRR